MQLRNLALARCAQFHVRRYSIPWTQATATWSASWAACAGSACPLTSAAASVMAASVTSKMREVFEHSDTPLGGVWVTRACLSQHDLRGEELVVRPLLVPPRHSELLMSCHKQIPARPCREVTDDARFDIDGTSDEA